jgi:hypothetical protein
MKNIYPKGGPIFFVHKITNYLLPNKLYFYDTLVNDDSQKEAIKHTKHT